jgi:SAM-dependent methyltransferase
MKWLGKAALQKALSLSPGSERLNYVLQTRITKQYPRSHNRFVHWTKIATQHFDIFLKCANPLSLSAVSFYEFGAGWDLIIPLTYYALGVDHQILIDIDPRLRLALVNNALRRFATHKAEIQHLAGRPLRNVGPEPVNDVNELEDKYGIAYRAPLDARDTQLPPGSVDFVSSTATLEHIPEPDILKIFQECYRILKPGGIISCRIDMVDHFAYFDSRISDYNFLKFPDRFWNLVNNRLVLTNRLRHADYVRLVKLAGFEIVEEQLERPTPTDLENLRKLKLARRFRERSLEELGVKRMNVVLRKNDPTRDSERLLSPAAYAPTAPYV